MFTKNYRFDYYPADRHSGDKMKDVYISATAALEFDEAGKLIGGTHESRFGTGKVLEIHEVSDGYSFAMDMGGGRVCWYRLQNESDILTGTCNPWNGKVTCPYFITAKKTAGDKESPIGKYEVFLYNGDRDTNAPSDEMLCKGWMEIFPAAGDLGGFIDLPFIRGGVCDFEHKDGNFFFRYTQCSNNTWYRMYRVSDEEWQGNVTGYPFHFAWPFHVVAVPEV